MPKAVKQITRPAITSSAVLVDARHEAGPMQRTAVNGQKRHQHGKPCYRQRKSTPVAFDQVDHFEFADATQGALHALPDAVTAGT